MTLSRSRTNPSKSLAFAVGVASVSVILALGATNPHAVADPAGPQIPRTTIRTTPAPAQTVPPVQRRASTTKAKIKSKSATRPPSSKSSSGSRNTGPASVGKNAGGIAQGARGDKVLALQTRLQELKYDVTDPDGKFGDQTYHAVMAFQKTNGLARTGRANVATLEALTTATDPVALIPTGGGDRVEIDLAKQVLFLFHNNGLFKVLSISSGSGKDFCVLDPETNTTGCDKAITPGGSFRVRSRFVGWRESKLGLLYNPLYFNGGIAIHGAASVPGYPASHGCVRIPMVSAEWFPNEVPDLTPVYVFGGENAPVPFNAKAPADTKPGDTKPKPATAPSTTGIAGTIPGPTIPGATLPGATTPGTTLPLATLPATTLPGASTLPGTTAIGGTTLPGTTVPRTTVPGTATLLPSSTVVGAASSTLTPTTLSTTTTGLIRLLPTTPPNA